jgi:hypothetical protein
MTMPALEEAKARARAAGEALARASQMDPRSDRSIQQGKGEGQV